MDFDPPTRNEQVEILRALDLTIEKLKSAEAELEEWLSEQSHLPQQIDKRVLTAFALFSGKGVEESKKRFDAYYTMRGVFPALFHDRDPTASEIKESGECVATGMCRGYTPKFSRLYVAKLVDTDPTKFHCNSLLRRLLFILDLTLVLDRRTDIYLVADCSGLSVKHFLKVSISQARDFMLCVQTVYPIRIRKIIFLNVKPYCKTLLENMVLPLLKKKIASRTQIFTNNIDNLEKVVPLNLLPSDMGGSGPSTKDVSDFWMNQLEEHREWFLTQGSLKSDESDRTGTSPLKAQGCSVM